MASSLRKLACVVLFSAAVAAAQEPERSKLPIKVEAQSSDFDYQKGVLEFDGITISQGEIRITAERAVASGLDFEDSRWEFDGAVRISMPEAALASDTASVRFAKGEIQSATVTGGPATFEQRREDELAQGRANRIDYDLGRGAVELAGDAWLSNGRTEITGATLVYSTISQRVVSRQQVVITINPNEPAAQAPDPTP
ncbi:MAG TPA: LptA/OstA family protein [Steroidobacteraceae bacterium]|nr:LptA/OstA family protein [Steroidobacteraceae bacterium]